MSKPISFEKVEADVVSTMEKTHGVPEPETPFRILIMGDFSGRANRGLIKAGSEFAVGRPIYIDRDNFDEVLARLGVEIHLPIGEKEGAAVAIRFNALDDFHPDQIFDRLEVFQKVREIRQKLKDPQTFAAAAAEVGGMTEIKTAEEPPEPPSERRTPTPELSGLTSGSLLDEVMEETQGQPIETRRSGRSSKWSAFLHEIVKPHLVPDMKPQQTVLVAAVDAAIGELIRAILHHPDFQAIEAAWRALYFLVSRLETDEQLKLYLLDISKAELAADLSGTEDLRSTRLYRLLVEEAVETPGGEPWAVVGGNYTFDHTRDDAALLGSVVQIAYHAGAPFIAAAHSHLLGCESLAETPDPDDWERLTGVEDSQAWEALRKFPEAPYLGLALPRFLLRLPYGAETDPTEQFDFEEVSGEPEHDHYLWGNPAFACVYLLAQVFTYYGWDLRPGIILDIEGLPLHLYKAQGETHVEPCAEVVLTDRAAETILEKGFMPLLSFRNQDKIRLARFQSIADPLTALAGRWGE